MFIDKSVAQKLLPGAPLAPPYYLSGVVERGDGRGKSLGFPTMNVAVPDITMPHGVYVVLARLHMEIHVDVFKGMAHVGTPKTFGIVDPRVEVHLFDFTENVYNQRVELNFLKLIRNVMQFENASSLQAQLHKDAQVAKHFLSNL